MSLVLGLIGWERSQIWALRTAGRSRLRGLCWDSRGSLEVLNWNQLRRSRLWCCKLREDLCQLGTRTEVVFLDGGGGEHQASPAAGHTKALYSCTSCCRDAPYLCCCGGHKRDAGEEFKWLQTFFFLLQSLLQFWRLQKGLWEFLAIHLFPPS